MLYTASCVLIYYLINMIQTIYISLEKNNMASKYKSFKMNVLYVYVIINVYNIIFFYTQRKK